jgi:spore maturation protein CgeB
VWEALWCRTFILEEENPVTKLYFEPYVDYVPFTTLKDLVGKVRYYLEHDKERDYIRMQGRTTVEKYYDAKLYWERLFKAAGVIDGVKSYKSREIWGKGI